MTVMQIIRLEFFDAIGTLLDTRLWTSRDGIVLVPDDTRQIRITVAGERSE